MKNGWGGEICTYVYTRQFRINCMRNAICVGDKWWIAMRTTRGRPLVSLSKLPSSLAVPLSAPPPVAAETDKHTVSSSGNLLASSKHTRLFCSPSAGLKTFTHSNLGLVHTSPCLQKLLFHAGLLCVELVQLCLSFILLSPQLLAPSLTLLQ